MICYPNVAVLSTTPLERSILGPAIIIECDNDQEAFDRASRTANGKALELWQGSRPILQLPADE
jgi:hypothetical protein